LKDSASVVIDRIRQELGLKTDAALARILGISASAISQVRKRDTVPLDWLEQLEAAPGFDRQFIKTGTRTKTMPGASTLANQDPSKKWATAVFSSDGQEEVYSEYPAAGIVTNASGLVLPVHHYAEYVLALEVRGKLDADGNLQLTGSGLPLPRERLKRWQADETKVRSLRTAQGLAVFDLGQTDECDGRSYIVEVSRTLLLRTWRIGLNGPEFVATAGNAPAIPAGRGAEGGVAIVGRIVMLCMEM
jgi:hypothetical protein